MSFISCRRPSLRGRAAPRTTSCCAHVGDLADSGDCCSFAVALFCSELLWLGQMTRVCRGRALRSILVNFKKAWNADESSVFKRHGDQIINDFDSDGSCGKRDFIF